MRHAVCEKCDNKSVPAISKLCIEITAERRLVV